MTLLDKFAPLAELRGALAASGKVPSVATPMDAIHSATEGVIDGRTVLLAGTNNYLGLTFDPECRAAAIKAVQALDIYTWLTYRASYLKRPTVIPWSSLALQFGSNYAELRNFKTAFMAELKKVVLVYGQVQVEATEHGLIVKPSLTHISKKGSA